MDVLMDTLEKSKVIARYYLEAVQKAGGINNFHILMQL